MEALQAETKRTSRMASFFMCELYGLNVGTGTVRLKADAAGSRPRTQESDIGRRRSKAANSGVRHRTSQDQGSGRRGFRHRPPQDPDSGRHMIEASEGSPRHPALAGLFYWEIATRKPMNGRRAAGSAPPRAVVRNS